MAVSLRGIRRSIRHAQVEAAESRVRSIGPLPSRRRVQAQIVRAAEEDGGGEGRGESYDDNVESLFARELRRRSIDPPGEDDERVGGQLDRSRDLNSEGLEGLPDRARQLLTLGATFFLAFLPLGAATALLFGALQLGFGDTFVHQGGKAPEYIDPNALLAPEAAPGAPMVPFPRYRNAMPEQAPAAPIETAAASEE